MRSNSHPTVLLTGFGPFPNVPRNASAVIVKRLAREARLALPHVRFAFAVLPTEWTRAPGLVSELHERHDPVLALHFGVASGMRGFRIETEARNFCRMSPDAAGGLPASNCICEGGASALATSVPATAVAQHLEAHGFEARLSDDAGGYLCNAVFYHSLLEASTRRDRCRVGFIHIPVEAGETEAVDRTVAGALEVLKFSLHHAPQDATLTSV